jgi:hypothetical protein
MSRGPPFMRSEFEKTGDRPVRTWAKLQHRPIDNASKEMLTQTTQARRLTLARSLIGSRKETMR